METTMVERAQRLEELGDPLGLVRDRSTRGDSEPQEEVLRLIGAR